MRNIELEPIEGRICQDCGSESFYMNHHGVIVCNNCYERWQPFNIGLLHKAFMTIGVKNVRL